MLAALAVLALTGGHASAVPRQDPGHCKGQPEIRPLEPIVLHTDKGVFTLKVEMAVTPLQREYGLMCRKVLASDRGMLFDFVQPQELGFWMRNTLIGLDIVYLGGDGRVVSIVRDAQPLNETPLPSNGLARAALELPAGRAAQIGLLPGDRVEQRIFRGR
jgi:uncharacterized membrane protein (UPF0127 family)